MKATIICDVCGFIHEIEQRKLNIKDTSWEMMNIPKPQYCPECKCLTRHTRLKESLEKVEFT